MDSQSSIVKILWVILLFPTLFQGMVLEWAWNAYDLTLEFVVIKRILVLLPVASVIAACWLSIACLLTIIVRQERRVYAGRIVMSWWDLARVLFRFWGGIFSFIFVLLSSLVAAMRMILFGIWLSVQDFVLVPFRAAQSVSGLATQPGVPWLAVLMTLAWCGLEAFIFTFVMRGLVVETLSGLTGAALDETTLQFVLYFMLLTFVVGSYAIVASLEQAIRKRDVKQIALVVLVELVAMVFEVLFLYREFVDALVPWFAQHAGDGFQLGITLTILIASLVWAGIRGMTWFLFAAHGTPPIMAIVQRTGLSSPASKGQGGLGGLFTGKDKQQFGFIKTALEHIHDDRERYEEWGEKLLSAFILPPLQVVAVVINFVTLLILGKTIFELPFKSYKDMIHANQNIKTD